MSRLKLSLLSLLMTVLSLSLLPASAQDIARHIPVERRSFNGDLSPDGSLLLIFEDMNLVAVDGVDPTLLPIRVLDPASGEERELLGGFSDFATDTAFSRDGSRLVTYHANGNVYVWDTANLADPVAVWYLPLLGQGRIQFMPDNQTIVIQAGGPPQRFLLVDITTGYITGAVGPRFSSLFDFQQNYTQFPAQGDVSFAAFEVSPDGSLLVTATINDEVSLWTMASNSEVTLRPPSEKFAQFGIRDLVFTPDGKSLLYADRADGMIHIWDVETGSESATLAGGLPMALSADGATLAWLGEAAEDSYTLFTAPLDALDEVTTVLKLEFAIKVIPPGAFLSFTPDAKQLVLGGVAAEEDVNGVWVIDVG